MAVVAANHLQVAAVDVAHVHPVVAHRVADANPAHRAAVHQKVLHPDEAVADEELDTPAAAD